MAQGKRIWQLDEETTPLPTDYVVIDRDTYDIVKKLKLSDIIIAASKCIDDAVIIATITDDANWTDGIYTGSVVGLDEGDYYLDTLNWIKYEYICSTLIRYSVNNII